MLRKSAVIAGMIFFSLSLSAFSWQAPAAKTPVGWSALLIVLAIILVQAILLIWQKHQTPDNRARYHLEEGGHSDHDHGNGTESAPEDNVDAGEAVTTSEEFEASVEEPAEPEELREDDFTQIEGIGPKISVLLHAAGIHTFADLAEADTGRIRQVLSEAGARFSLADPTSWPEQAHYLEAGDQENFKRITQRLKGGRQVE